MPLRCTERGASKETKTFIIFERKVMDPHPWVPFVQFEPPLDQRASDEPQRLAGSLWRLGSGHPMHPLCRCHHQKKLPVFFWSAFEAPTQDYFRWLPEGTEAHGGQESVLWVWRLWEQAAVKSLRCI